MNPEVLMRRVLELARKGEGFTSPNPMVGALLVKDGEIIGEGYHERYGERHAEVAAIENARTSVEGATLYCNLEPCCNGIPRKNTPPCTNRIIQEKIKKVVVSTLDPNPHVNGKGLQELRDNGIQVEVGLLAKEATLLNEKYFKFIQTGQPFVQLKIAQSLDGRIATRSGDSRWITGEEARRRVHQWRHAFDAILVGINTVITDDPALTVRPFRGKQPLRIILDPHLRIPPNCQLLNDDFTERTLIVTLPDAPSDRRAILQSTNVRIVTAETSRNSQISLSWLLSALAKEGISSVLVEGGAGVFTSFLKENVGDKLSLFIAPIIIGEGKNAIGDLGVERIADALRLQQVSIEPLQDEVLIQGYFDLQRTFGILRENL